MTIEASNLTPNDIQIRLIKRLLHACVREQLLPHTIKGNQLIIPLKRINKSIIANNVQLFNLGKFKIHGEVLIVSQGISNIINDINHLLDLIYHEIHDTVDATQWKNFVAEINNCRENNMTVVRHMQKLNHQLANDVSLSSSKTLFEFISTQHSPTRQAMFYEAWATKGHPYHPCHKTRLGFSPSAYLMYSPEFNQDINLPVAALDKTIMHVESRQDHFDYNHWFAKQYPQIWEAWLEKITEKNLSADNYYPIFIHPWQYENVLTKLFHAEIANKQLILFQDVCINTKASLSFRTLIVKDESNQPHIKLPVAVQSTSAMRTISPASVQNGPKFGNILKQILKIENNFDQCIRLAYEACGLHIKHPDPEIAKYLGIIYRENPANLLDKNQNPIVVAALFETSPVNKMPLLIEIIHGGKGKTLNDAIEFFDQYSKIVLRAYFDLFLIYGIALEGHQQNTLAVFENNHPVYMIARDLGGVRIHTPTLQKQGFDIEVFPESSTVTDDRQEVTNDFLHSVIQYHLGDLSLLLAQHYQTSENVFWKIIKNNIVSRFNALKNKVEPQRWETEYKAILEEDWQIKGLMSMRLKNIYKKYIYIHLKNPLRDI